MKKINPIFFFNLLLLIFTVGGFFLVYFFVKIKIGFLGIICISLIALFLSFLLYTINFGIPTSNKIIKKNESRKNSLFFDDKKVTINNPTLEKNITIYWNSIEAIFLLNKPPLDGEYHNFEYLIILNSEPKEIKYETQSWYNRITIFPKPKRKGLSIIRINDDSNRDFHTFNGAINRYLTNINEEKEKYLNLKFSNEVQYKKSGNATKATISKPLKSIGFYKIFDRDNNLTDENLNRFREETKNNK